MKKKFCNTCKIETDRYANYDCKPCNKRRLRKNREENRERVRAVARAFYAANKDKINAKNIEWQKLNPEAVRVAKRNRRARERNADGSHTTEDVKNLLILQKQKCACCKISIKNGYHVDHIIPLVKGGSNGRINLQLLCPTCNLQKNARNPIEFMQSKGYLL